MRTTLHVARKDLWSFLVFFSTIPRWNYRIRNKEQEKMKLTNCSKLDEKWLVFSCRVCNIPEKEDRILSPYCRNGKRFDGEFLGEGIPLSVSSSIISIRVNVDTSYMTMFAGCCIDSNISYWTTPANGIWNIY